MSDAVVPTVVENSGWGGGWFMWVFFLFFLLAWGRGGLFGNGNMSAANFVNNDFLYTNLNNTLNQGFSNVLDRQYEQVKETMRGFNGVEQQLCSLGSSVKDNIYDLSFRQQQGVYDLSAQLAQNGFNAQQCCCETNRNIDSLKAENYKNTCEITNAVHAEGEATRALITNNVMQELRDKLQAAQMHISNLSQTQSIQNYLRPTPVPAYLTCSPYDNNAAWINNQCRTCNG